MRSALNRESSRSILGALCLALVAALIAGCPGEMGPQGPAGPEGPEGPQGGPAALTAGLNVTINGVVIGEDLIPEVTFTATDDDGNLIPLSQFKGSRDIRFVLAYLVGEDGTGQYRSYVTTGEDGTGSATYDHNLADGLSENADGTITYKFEHAIAEDYEMAATHQVGGQFTRTRPVTGETYDTNALLVFRPDGAAVTATREISTTATCNECHTKLTLHGRRTELQYCILCHNPQSVDPDTGNSVDMPELIHKIHMGADLPSVEAGTPYQIIGYRNSVHDYSTVHFPQPVNNCTVCHTDAVDDAGDPVAPHAANWKTNPTAVACGACHDDVNFETGDGHVAGPQANDNNCAACHSETSIMGYHNTEYPKLVLETTADDISVDGTGLITFAFSASDTDGNPITDLDDGDKYRVGYLVGWPAEEYEEYIGNSRIGGDLTNNSDGTYTYTAAAGEEIPVGTTTSFGFTFRGRSHLNLDDDPDFETRHPMQAPALITFRTDGGEALTRRSIVDDAMCAKCHGAPFAGHGSDRIGEEVCLICHNVNLVSEPDVGEPVTVNFKDMIHSIHTGEALEEDYITGGHGGDVDFGHVRFPGLRGQCSICHGDNAIELPLAEEALPTVVAVDTNEDDVISPDEVISTTLPTMAACTSCHDNILVGMHALVNTQDGVETCAVCHGPHAAFDIGDQHGDD